MHLTALSPPPGRLAFICGCGLRVGGTSQGLCAPAGQARTVFTHGGTRDGVGHVAAEERVHAARPCVGAAGPCRPGFSPGSAAWGSPGSPTLQGFAPAPRGRKELMADPVLTPFPGKGPEWGASPPQEGVGGGAASLAQAPWSRPPAPAGQLCGAGSVRSKQGDGVDVGFITGTWQRRASLSPQRWGGPGPEPGGGGVRRSLSPPPQLPSPENRGPRSHARRPPLPHSWRERRGLLAPATDCLPLCCGGLSGRRLGRAWAEATSCHSPCPGSD